MTTETLDEANELLHTDSIMRQIHESLVNSIEGSIKSKSGLPAAKELELKELEKKLIKVCAEHILPIRKTVQDKFKAL